jgi:hypothetical protein
VGLALVFMVYEIGCMIKEFGAILGVNFSLPGLTKAFLILGAGVG